jgi:Ca-activated chloride channel family protein
MNELMTAWQNFHFLYPLWFLILIPVFLLLIWFSYRQQRQSLVHRLVDPQLAPFILSQSQQRTSKRFFLWASLFSLIAATALAGPSWQQIKQHSFQKQQALVILFDLSSSMYATDMKPDRLTRARFELIDLLKQRKEGQTGLIVYAGAPFVVSPLTDDVDTIQEQIKYLSPKDMPVQGSQLAFAVEKAVDLLKQAGLKEGQILAMSDGVSDMSATRHALTKARQQGYTTSIMAFGNAEGSPIPLPNGGFLKDKAGNIVIPRTDLESLKSLRQQGQGVFVQAQFNDQDLNQLLPQLSGSSLPKNLQEDETRTIKTWRNEGIWLVVLLVPFALLVFRRGVLFSVMLVIFVLPQSHQVSAATWWDELWATPDQRAQQALENNKAKMAAETFADPAWKAAANYRAGDYAKAIELYQQQNDVESLYNLGNALAKSGKYEKAIEAYEKVLAQQADHEDAKYNLELLKKLQQQAQNQQQQNNQQGDSKSQQDQQSQNDASQQAQNSDTQGQQGQNGAEQDSASQDDATQQTDNNSEAQGDQMSKEQQQAKENAEKEREALEQAMAEEAKKSTEEQPAEQASLASNEQATEREQAQATQQWLRRIPDDPSGLWRRKFYYQYRQSAQRQGIGDQTQAW